MNKVEKGYLTMLCLVRVKEIKEKVKDNKNINKEELVALGGELRLLSNILDKIALKEIFKDDKNINIQS